MLAIPLTTRGPTAVKPRPIPGGAAELIGLRVIGRRSCARRGRPALTEAPRTATDEEGDTHTDYERIPTNKGPQHSNI